MFPNLGALRLSRHRGGNDGDADLKGKSHGYGC